jgi:hypothetical protein
MLTGHAIAPKLGNETAKYVNFAQTWPHAPLGVIQGTAIKGQIWLTFSYLLQS